MDPQVEKNPGLHLPEPSSGGGEFFHGQYEDMTPKPEMRPLLPESRGMTQPQVASLPAAPLVPIQPVADDGSGNSAVLANDNTSDELDKEWVSKAKMIVEKTKNDPHRQSNELGQVKADYLRIRFNKHIKVTQDKAS